MSTRETKGITSSTGVPGLTPIPTWEGGRKEKGEGKGREGKREGEAREGGRGKGRGKGRGGERRGTEERGRKREGKNVRRKICITKYPEQIVWL